MKIVTAAYNEDLTAIFPLIFLAGYACGLATMIIILNPGKN
jgi:hypothetical protein